MFATLVTTGLLLVAQDAAPTPTPSETATEVPSALDRAATVARDGRIAFSPTSALRARNDIAAGLPPGYARDIAVMAVACGGSVRDIEVLEKLAEKGEEPKAAILALGEIGRGGAPALLRIVDAQSEFDADILEALALALLRSRAPDALTRLRELSGESGALAEPALAMVPFLESRDLPDRPIVDELYELRWQAGRHYGRVDGRRRRAVLLQELSARREFLDRVLLEASLERDIPAVYEHLLEMVKADRGVGAVRAAAMSLPAGLADWMNEGVWQPASDEEWAGIVDSIALHEIEVDALDVLQFAFEREELASEVGLLILRGGGALPERWAERELATSETPRRAELLRALGDRGDASFVPDLLSYLNDDPDPRVRAAALVSLRRLGSEEALRTIEDTLDGGPGEIRTELVVSLARSAHRDSQIRAHLRDAAAIADLTPRAALAADLGLARLGLLADRSDLRRRLVDAPADERRILVRVLAENAEEEDIQLFQRLFPVEGDLEVNVELAIALVRHRDNVMSELLRRLLWKADWNQSVLAGGLLIRAGGMHTLLDELDIPPSSASDRDRRRVGFALGQWSGFAAVEALARRRNETDPALQGAYLGALASQTR